MSFKVQGALGGVTALSAQSSPGDCMALQSRLGSGRLLPWLFSLKQLVNIEIFIAE
jgi:hypothetical protein